MSGLPDRPDLDQLRRQARELLRAAANGEPGAVARLRAVSERVTLSAAQLALAREHGYPSWPRLRAEVKRRRLSESLASPSSQGGNGQGWLDAREERWSFGGAAVIGTPAGLLFPDGLVAGAGRAVLYATVTPSESGQFTVAASRRLPAPGTLLALWSRRGRERWSRRGHAHAAMATMRSLRQWASAATVVDDRGATHALGMEGVSGRRGLPAESVRLRVDPVPVRGTRWIELRGQDGAATRLLPSARAAVRAGRVAPVRVSPAERELADQALSLIALHLGGGASAREDILRQRCSAALARTAQIQRSGELDPASELPDQLTRLCSVLTGDRPAAGLPSSWSGMLHAAGRADGPRHHLDIGAALPTIDGVTVQADTLLSSPGSWRLYLRASPGWRNYSEADHRRRSLVSVHAEDDLGGTYASEFDSNTGPPPREEDLVGNASARRGYEEFALEFLPRLDPLARALKLTCRGASEEVAVHLGLVPAAGA
jgi:hypothetical protein